MGQSPGNITAPINATSTGALDPDDVLFQNLLSTEWAIYSFHQQGVEVSSSKDFTGLWLPKTTYNRIAQMRDNEARHLRLLPRPGLFEFREARGLQIQLWRAYRCLECQAILWTIRHSVPYANQILDVTNEFIVPGSCPSENPVYPSPRQNPPPLSFNINASTGEPGSDIEFVFLDETNVPTFDGGKEYYAVSSHGVNNLSVLLDTKRNSSVIPLEFKSGRGIIVAVLAEGVGAPTSESVGAGPVFLLEHPQELTRQI
ncbi:hypothetical protein MPH_04710 [Macrophomina phaseolina MS6]|uniref:Uncharacterized protein n=1 Tax=Macrophomina phaseolina (strain MS6) TaxID=1126212 RepID=K2SMN3_MACPH|nr:hypothetical protein MPH_04710 [Macrophomina phaseolina MS6]